MTQFYVLMIKTGKMKLNEVPALWRKSVKAELEYGREGEN